MPFYAATLLITGPPEEVESAGAKHEEYLKRLRSRGRLVTAGRLGKGDGYLEIFEADDRLEAEEIARSSPLVEAGLVAWMLREWTELD